MSKLTMAGVCFSGFRHSYFIYRFKGEKSRADMDLWEQSGRGPRDDRKKRQFGKYCVRNLTPGGGWFPIPRKWFNSGYICRNAWRGRSAAGPRFRAAREQGQGGTDGRAVPKLWRLGQICFQQWNQKLLISGTAKLSDCFRGRFQGCSDAALQ